MRKIKLLLTMSANVAMALTVAACRTDSGNQTAGPGQPAPSLSASAAPPGELIRVGLIAPLTGSYSALGSEDKKAVELAVEQANQNGGLLGRKIELLVRNDQTQPDQSILAFNDIKGAGVVAVIGSAFSNSALATEPLAERNQIPYLSLTPAQEQVQPIKPYVFVMPALASTYADRYLAYMQSAHIAKIAIAHDTKSAYAVAGYSAMVALASKYGIAIVKDEEFETTTADFSPVFTHLHGSGAQAFVFWGTGPSGVTVTKQHAATKVKVPLFVTGSQASKLWLEPVGEAAEGVTLLSAIGVVGEYLPEGPQKQIIQRMAVPYKARYGYPPPQFAQDGYSACLLLFEAIKVAGSTDRGKIRQALEQMTLITPNGKFRYSPTDHSGLTGDFVSVNVVKGGQIVPTDWAKEQLAKAVAAE